MLPVTSLPADPEFAEILQLSCRPSLGSVDRLRELLAHSEKLQSAVHRVFALAALSMSLYAKDPRASLAMAYEALPGMRGLQTRLGLALVWTAIGTAHRELGDLSESLAALEEALDIERALNSAQGQARALANLSITLRRLGRRSAGLASLEEALSLVPAGDEGLRVSLLNNLASALAQDAGSDREEDLPPAHWRPRAERAADLAREVLALPDALLRTSLENVNYPRGCLAKALVVLDELDEALPLLLELQEAYAAADNTYAQLFVQQDLVQALLQAGQPARARDTARQAISLAMERNFVRQLDAFWLLLSRAYEALGEWEPALRAFQAHHRIKLQAATQLAEAAARKLAVRLDTARAQRESRCDPLTGLLNRRGFGEAIEAAVAKASGPEPLALLLIDLDFFKSVNDSNGHAHGDQALVLVAQQLQNVGRSQDQAARLGGDEFAWIGSLTASQAAKVAQRLQQNLRTESLARWPDQPALTLSIGIAVACQPCDVDSLIQRADGALYAAKAAGRNCVRCAEGSVSAAPRQPPKRCS